MKTKIEVFCCDLLPSGNYGVVVGYRGEKDTAILVKGVGFNQDRIKAVKSAVASFRSREANT
jgi:hypothetical protein